MPWEPPSPDTLVAEEDEDVFTPPSPESLVEEPTERIVPEVKTPVFEEPLAITEIGPIWPEDVEDIKRFGKKAERALTPTLPQRVLQTLGTTLGEIVPTEGIEKEIAVLQAEARPRIKGEPRPVWEREETLRPWGTAGQRRAREISTGVATSLANTVNFFTSPIGLATLGMAKLPPGTQRLIALGFAGSMAKESPEIFRQLGEQFGKPESERDYAKISQLVTDAITTTGFTALAAKHGLRPAPDLPMVLKGKWQGPLQIGEAIPMPRGAPAPRVEPPAIERATPAEAAAARERMTREAAEGVVPPEKPPLKKDFEARLKADEEFFQNQLNKVPAKSEAIQLQDISGKKAIVSKEPTDPSKWRLTWFTSDMQPWGHAVFDSRDNAIRSGLGLYGDYGPPHLPRGYTVVKTKQIRPVVSPTPTVPTAPAVRPPVGLEPRPVIEVPKAPKPLEAERRQIVRILEKLEEEDARGILRPKEGQEDRVDALRGRLGEIERELIRRPERPSEPAPPIPPAKPVPTEPIPVPPTPPVAPPAELTTVPTPPPENAGLPALREAAAKYESQIAAIDARIEQARAKRDEVDKIGDDVDRSAKQRNASKLESESLREEVLDLAEAKRLAKSHLANVQGNIGLARMRAEAAPFRGVAVPSGKQTITGKVLKTQKETLVSQLNDAIKAAPQTGEERITISVPDDGDFTIRNTKESIQAFKSRVQSDFPETVGKLKESKLPSGRAKNPPRVATPQPTELPKLVGETVSKDKTRFTIQYAYADGTQIIATDGRQLVRIVTKDAPGALHDPVRIDAKGRILRAGTREGDAAHEGTFPNWTVIYPKNPSLVYSGLDTGQLFHLARQAEVFRDTAIPDKGKREIEAVEILINPDRSIGARMEIKGGDAAGDVFQHNVQDGAQSIGAYNPDYILNAVEIARRLGNEKVDVLLEGQDGPLMLRGSNFEHITMPLRPEGKDLRSDVLNMESKSGRPMYSALPEGLGPMTHPDSFLVSYPERGETKFKVELQSGEVRLSRYKPRGYPDAMGRTVFEYSQMGDSFKLKDFEKILDREDREAFVRKYLEQEYGEKSPEVTSGKVESLTDGVRNVIEQRKKLLDDMEQRKTGRLEARAEPIPEDLTTLPEYSQTDLARYRELDRLTREPKSAEEVQSPEYQRLWREKTELQNKYGGKIPKQLAEELQGRGEGFVGVPLPESELWLQLRERFEIVQGRNVSVVYDPMSPAGGRPIRDKVTGQVVGIELNRANIATPAQLNWVMQHEIAHAAEIAKPSLIQDAINTLEPEVRGAVKQKVKSLKYDPSILDKEQFAREVQILAERWSKREWFEKLVGHISRFAHSLGIKLSRLGAESVAVRALAQNLRRLRREGIAKEPLPVEETLAAKLPETPPLEPGDRLVTLQHPDGRLEVAAWNPEKAWKGWGPGGTDLAAVARVREGKWSHGMLKPEVKIIDDGGTMAMQGALLEARGGPNPSVAVPSSQAPTAEIVRQNKDFNIFNRLNSGQWSFYFGRLGKAAQAAWMRMALGEFRMRENIRRDVLKVVDEPLKALPRQFRRKGGQEFFNALNGKDINQIIADWSGKPGGDVVIEQARAVKGRLEEIRVTIRDIKRDSYSRYLNGLNKNVLTQLHQKNIGPLPGGMTKADLIEALAMDSFPENWGIADGSYLPHLFFGQWKVTAQVPGQTGSQFVLRAQTPSEAKAKIFELSQGNTAYQNASFAIELDTVVPADMIRLGDRRFWNMIQRMKAQAQNQLNPQEAVQGIIGRKASKQKWFGSLQKREGFTGYAKDYRQVMTAYLNGFHRWKELSAMNRAVAPLIEQVRREGRLNAEARLNDIVENLWGKPSRLTMELDAFIRQIPVVRDFIKPLALDRWSRFANALVTNLTLRTLRFGTINRLQPLQGLYPLIGEKLMIEAKIMQHTAAGRQLLDEAGVTFDPGQYATQYGVRTKVREVVERLSGERSNQELAFLGMYLHGRNRGMSHEGAIRYGKLRGQLLTQFTPLIVDAVPLMEGPVGRVLFQFKRFPIKQVELLSRMVADRNLPGLTRFAASMAATGGIAWLLRQTYTDYEKRARAKRLLNAELGQKGGDLVWYGLPGLIGGDLSGSMVLGDEPFGSNVYEKLGRGLVGPGISITAETARALATARRAAITDSEKALIALRRIPSLRPIAEIADLIRQNTDVMTPDGEIKYRRKLHDVLLGLGSFRSANESNMQLAISSIIELKKEIQGIKNQYWVASQSGDETALEKIGKDIENFNNRWPEAAISGQELREYMKYRKGMKPTDIERVAGKKFGALIPPQD